MMRRQEDAARGPIGEVARAERIRSREFATPRARPVWRSSSARTDRCWSSVLQPKAAHGSDACTATEEELNEQRLRACLSTHAKTRRSEAQGKRCGQGDAMETFTEIPFSLDVEEIRTLAHVEAGSGDAEDL